jgi:hypothetical protein
VNAHVFEPFAPLQVVGIWPGGIGGGVPVVSVGVALATGVEPGTGVCELGIGCAGGMFVLQGAVVGVGKVIPPFTITGAVTAYC